MTNKHNTGTADPGPDEQSSTRVRWRRPLAGFLAVVAAFSLVLAVTATWMRSTLLNTDVWVESVATLPANQELQSLVAVKVADEALTLIDLPGLLDNAIGPAGRFLAGPLENASRGFIENATTKVVGSSQFEAIWVEANRLAHEQAVALLRGEDDTTVVDGKVTFDLAPVINNVVAQASLDTPDLFGGAIAIPEITPDEAPQAADRLAGALGVTIPPTFGQVQLFDADTLTSAQRAVRILDGGVVALWVLFAIAVVGGLVASLDRRRTVASLGLVTAGAAVAIWLLREPLENDIVDGISSSSGQTVAQIVIDAALWRNLGPLVLALVAISLVAAATAYLIGPSATAAAVRQTVRGMFRGDDQPQTTASLFLRRHTAAFRIAGAAAALGALFSLPHLTWGWFLTIAVVLAAYQVSWIYVVPLENEPAMA